MADKYSKGDVVELKSGGPAMTIVSEAEGNSMIYTCVWFKGASREQGRFPEDSLQAYVAPTK